jgi:hypothetical protein
MPDRLGFRLVNNVSPIDNLTDDPKYRAGINIPILPSLQLVAIETDDQYGVVAKFKYGMVRGIDIHRLSFLSSLDNPGIPRNLRNKRNFWYVRPLAKEEPVPVGGEVIHDPIMCLVVGVSLPDGPSKVKLYYRLPKILDKLWCLIEVDNLEYGHA